MVNAISIDGDQEEDEVVKPNIVFKAPVYSSKAMEYLPKKSNLFEGKTFMAKKPMIPVGIKLNLDGVRNIKKALTT